jgi:hypothetical protein
MRNFKSPALFDSSKVRIDDTTTQFTPRSLPSNARASLLEALPSVNRRSPRVCEQRSSEANANRQAREAARQLPQKTRE